jgi:hypothetical protein
VSLKRVWIPSPHFSSRSGSSVRLIVLHTAEGATTIESLGRFFQGSVQASSHVGADDKKMTIGEYVKRENKAWTVADYNPVSVNIELCAFASWSSAEWAKHPNMLENCANWIAEEAKFYGLPIQALTAGQAQASGKGVCQHRDLGTRGGGHHDCGDGFPITKVLEMARNVNKPKPPVGASGDAKAAIVCHLGRKANVWQVQGTPSGNVHFGGKDEWEVAEVAVNRKTGKWRIRRK